MTMNKRVLGWKVRISEVAHAPEDRVASAGFSCSISSLLDLDLQLDLLLPMKKEKQKKGIQHQSCTETLNKVTPRNMHVVSVKLTNACYTFHNYLSLTSSSLSSFLSLPLSPIRSNSGTS